MRYVLLDYPITKNVSLAGLKQSNNYIAKKFCRNHKIVNSYVKNCGGLYKEETQAVMLILAILQICRLGFNTSHTSRLLV